ncbi:hypothetical protein BSKO_07801 [Bryopsis sp. KO-2023]|nr:hypothetical protein BSKO_07801 [Bryopsis sp. KO-2023]
MHRVKVYCLSKEGNWDDKGTGNATIQTLQNKAPGLVVTSEDDERPLLVHKVHRDVRYGRQSENTIITWLDPDLKTEMALSFQESLGCNSIFTHLNNMQKEDGGRGGLWGCMMGDFDTNGERESGGDYTETVSAAPVEIPEPSMGNLEELARILSDVMPMQRERLAVQIMANPCFVPRVVELFRQCEDLEDQKGLALLHRIVRGLVLMTDSSVLEELVKEEFVMSVVGALEYDPDIPVHINHREFLQHKVVFKEVIPITNPAVVSKIHQTYRIQYLKDVVLPRLMDDQVTSTMTSFVMLNQMDIISALDRDEKFLPDLFEKLKGMSRDDPGWQDLVSFLQEFCMGMKLLQPRVKQLLFSKMVNLGMYDVLTEVMRQTRVDVRLKATEIFASAVMHDISSFRKFLIRQPNHELMGFMIRDLIEGGGNGLSEQFLEILRSLLESESMDGDDKPIVDVMYEEFMSKLVEALGDVSATSRVASVAKGCILELMGFCVQHHAYNIKYYFLRNNVLDKVVLLLGSREKWLGIACIRFLRTCVSMKDDFYERYIVRNNLLEPVVEIFLKNGDRYNLLNSTVIELVDFIRRENLKMLICHLVEKFYHKFKDIRYVQTFQELKQKYDKAQETRAGNGVSQNQNAYGGGGVVSRKRRDARDMEAEEEDYFSEADHGVEEERAQSEAALSQLSLSQRDYYSFHPRNAENPEAFLQNGHKEEPSTAVSAPLEESAVSAGQSPVATPSSTGGESSGGGGGSGGVLGGLVDYDDDEEEIEPKQQQVQVQQGRQSSGLKRGLDHRLQDGKRRKKEVLNCG